jgi:hypothetical protein
MRYPHGAQASQVRRVTRGITSLGFATARTTVGATAPTAPCRSGGSDWGLSASRSTGNSSRGGSGRSEPAMRCWVVLKPWSSKAGRWRRRPSAGVAVGDQGFGWRNDLDYHFVVHHADPPTFRRRALAARLPFAPCAAGGSAGFEKFPFADGETARLASARCWAVNALESAGSTSYGC